MQFAKLLQEFAKVENEKDESLPFVDYKKLKKLLKEASEKQQRQAVDVEQPNKNEPAEPSSTTVHISTEEKKFIQLLQQDLEKINAIYMEREEEAIIRLHQLGERKQAISSKSTKELEALRIAFVDFHGELVLLLHCSLVNYAGVAKILKKHDKLIGEHAIHRTGLQNILKQPFTSTESISRLVREAEEHVKSLSLQEQESIDALPSSIPTTKEEEMSKGKEEKQTTDHNTSSFLDDTTKQLHGSITGDRIAQHKIDGNDATKQNKYSHDHVDEAILLKRTRAALGMLARLQDSAHTPSTFILPAHAINKEGEQEEQDADVPLEKKSKNSL